MKNIFKVLAGLLGLVGIVAIVWTALYFTVPKVKDWTNTNILKQEQSVDGDKDEQIADLQEQLASKNEQVNTITVELNSAKEKLSEAQNSALKDAETIAELQEALAEKTVELSEAVQAKEELESSVSTLQAEITAKQATIAELEADVESNAETIAELEADIQAKQATIAELEVDAEANAETIAELEADIQEKQGTIETLQADISAKETNITNLNGQVSTLQSQLAEANTQLETKEGQITALTSQVATLTEDKQELESTLAEKNATIEELQSTASTLQSQLDLKAIEIASLNQQIETLENALDRDPELTYIDDLLGSGTISAKQVDTNKYLVCSDNAIYPGLYLFNSIDYSLMQLYTEGNSWKYYLELDNGDYLVTGGSNSIGVLYYDNNLGTIQCLYNSYVNWANLSKLTNGDAVISSRSSINQGILFFDYSEKSVQKIYSSGYDWEIDTELPNGDVLICSKTQTQANYGVLLINSTTQTAEALTDTGFYYTSIVLNNGDVVFGGNSTILYVDTTSYEATSVSLSGQWNYLIEAGDGNVLLASTMGSSNSGIGRLNTSTKTATLAYSSGSSYTNMTLLSNGDVLIISTYSYLSESKGVLLYSTETGEISNIYNITVHFKFVYALKNGNALIGPSNIAASEYGLYLYDANDKSIKCIYESGQGWDTFIEDDNGVTITASRNSLDGTLYYDYSTGTCTKVTENTEALAA